jgi:hypothetical protein
LFGLDVFGFDGVYQRGGFDGRWVGFWKGGELVAKANADWVGEKEEGWAGEYEAVEDPTGGSVRHGSQGGEVGRREKMIESSRRCGCQGAVIDGLPNNEADEKEDSDGNPSP